MGAAETRKMVQEFFPAFMEELKANNLVIVPADYAEDRRQEIKLKKLKRATLKKNLLTFKEISDAQLWGEISPKAVRDYAMVKASGKRYIKKGELLKVPKGEREIWKLSIVAVERIAKAKGTWSSIVE
ncbi:hypothetical protein [Zunongwangia profunda]|uniref:hypothetical protein n=1 Tax=Zunongwangia profunda TaxID=398743 RepID=UPI00248D9DB4|nr:hypothetical protein [Zunongwangia profunda]|tara:strand:- start:26265 stop:26648 length:384 start_codon:yes stop_codon:yes gene_type:complete